MFGKKHWPPGGRAQRPVEGSNQSDRSFDLRRGDRDAITGLQHLVRATGLPINADQIVARLGARDSLLEELRDGRSFGNLDVVCETASVVIDHEDFHKGLSVTIEDEVDCGIS